MTGHKLRLSKKEVTVKDGKIIRKIGFRAGVKRRVDEARASKEAAAWTKKSKTPAV